MQRPSLNTLMEGINADVVDVIVVYKKDWLTHTTKPAKILRIPMIHQRRDFRESRSNGICSNT